MALHCHNNKTNYNQAPKHAATLTSSSMDTVMVGMTSTNVYSMDMIAVKAKITKNAKR